MTNWSAIAVARELDIPLDSLAKITPVLDTLEEAFRPLLEELPPAYTEFE